ncbi:TPA: Fe-S cluster assembly protein SufD [Candidatus Woesearchaeota archaeon]|nr:Fe-S cluster assembly protein SufD [Candidatus Woesearchaeota archaeon]
MIAKTETLNTELKKTVPRKTFPNITEDLIRDISKARDEPKWLLDKRLSALKLFNESAMPDFKYGITVKMNAVELDYNKLEVDSLLQKKSIEIEKKRLEEYVKQGIIILDFYEALKQKKYEELIKKYFMTECVKAKDKIVALHAALFSRGLLIYIPKGKQINGTVEIDFEVDNSLNFDNILVIGEENSKATIVENIFAADNKSKINNKEHANNKNIDKDNNNNNNETHNLLQYRSSVVEIIANPSSNLIFCSVQNLNRETFNFSFKTAIIEKDAVFNWVDACMGSKFSHAETTSLMKGAGSRTNNWGMFLADKEQQFGIHANTIHFTHNTISDMLTRGIIADKAKTIYQGLIHIQQPAGQSNGYQRADAILMSDTAEADVIPMLEIDNSDVRCTHGSTVGQIDKEKLFYLMARGMDEETARKELIRGFYEQMLARINIKELTGILRAIIYERLGIEQESIINIDK